MSSKEHKKKQKHPAAEADEERLQTAEAAEQVHAPERIEMDVAELEELKRARDEYDRLMERLRRVSADLENYRKRVEKQRQAWSHEAIEAFVLDLLPVFDDLDRAIEAVKTATSPDDIVSGIKIIESHLTKVLESHGVERIHCLREPFDPSCHEAVEVDASVQHPEPVVLKEYQRGYRFAGKVVKPAVVKVSAKEPAEAQPEELPEDSSAED
jgi:molecular chaperone GrpE